ncbi:predicted protein [Sclerotinia sclerotiorum 1980 UF-70]|uniref:Uncharacterized protein n=1 Tax=Sclerotinia sclerotiorum (strain ATCC 18683 / 1980 / Ss-1) TaxID=665079 RepID=A7EQ20_SCLS1|nr:predicted protein [Sclerotinia sclerotiorum 1980 UF-70]EDO04936.1 predicted protein [Sclerotinia sclerotiorum 1980 UF-70]
MHLAAFNLGKFRQVADLEIKCKSGTIINPIPCPIKSATST